jgi:serine/threonine-protein kinase HipA
MIRGMARLIADGWREALRREGVSGGLARTYEAAFIHDQADIALGL